MTVQPIRDMKKIKKMYNYLEEYNPKYAVLFKMGINTGLRISDIIPIKISDIYHQDFNFKEHLIVIEQKTGKEKRIKLNDTLRKCLNEYVKKVNFGYNDYLFYSRKGGHVGRVQVYKVLKKAAESLGIENFGTHSLRKTWGYWTYKLSKYNIALIMDTFNHSSQAVTLRYIGINQEQKDELYSIVQL